MIMRMMKRKTVENGHHLISEKGQMKGGADGSLQRIARQRRRGGSCRKWHGRAWWREHGEERERQKRMSEEESRILKGQIIIRGRVRISERSKRMLGFRRGGRRLGLGFREIREEEEEEEKEEEEEEKEERDS